MDRIVIIVKKNIYIYNLFIGICRRSQVSIYWTFGPLYR